MFEILEENLATLKPRLINKGLIANFLIFKRLVNAADTDEKMARADAILRLALRNN